MLEVRKLYSKIGSFQTISTNFHKFKEVFKKSQSFQKYKKTIFKKLQKFSKEIKRVI